ncbi:23S rRNA (adenine(2503)-C(2))-methyltransferase RlmN [Candidatus Sumerlaeota bacterium]|nr:23S rRNA (adenine(2503)-C(2))-methyltransferase RlmN [Candidatus Sumerlaeota bacterium]
MKHGISKTNLRGMTFVEIEAAIQSAGFKGYRAKQIYQWIYRHDVRSIDEMTNLPQDIRAFLSEHFSLSGVTLKETLSAPDGSSKFLFSLKDGLLIESVLMPQDNRRTLCLSTQVGCSLGCVFCVTGRIGLKRNLSVAEIIDQAQCLRYNGYETHNLVFMGMGEPLLNTAALLPAIRLLTAPEGIAIPTRRITVSTAGVVPGIRALSKVKTGVNLAVSLNAANDALRTKIMPINKKYPLKDVIGACREFPLDNRRTITFEYVMLKGLNDSERDAMDLAALVKGVKCKINLIRFNEDEHIPYKGSSSGVVDKFREILTAKGYTVAVRYSKGQDIKAACGQLAARYL